MNTRTHEHANACTDKHNSLILDSTCPPKAYGRRVLVLLLIHLGQLPILTATIICVILLNLCNLCFSQGGFNNFGAKVFVVPVGFVVVEGGVVNQNSGTFDNHGVIILKGNWTNNAGNAAFINSSPGTVVFLGDTQNIQGSDVTLFYNLSLQGTGVKYQKIDAMAEGTLALNNRELYTDTFTMFVLSTDTGAISRTTGFVSSLDSGSLSRNTADTNIYLFPVGSTAGTFRYRPVEIRPGSVAAHTFTVRMANTDAAIEGFDRAVKDSSLCIINPDFYHRINRTAGTGPAGITIYFDDSLDNAFQAIAHWQNIPQWENTGTVTVINNVSPILSSINRSTWNDFSYTPFALATSAPVVDLLSSDSTICTSDSVIFTATSGFANYEFFVNGSTVQIGADSVFITTTLSGSDTIHVVVTDTGCTAKSNEITSIIVNPLPVVNLGLDTTACVSTVLDAGNTGADFNWSTTDTIQTIIVDTTGTYWVDVTNASGCITRDSINVTINSLPIANITPIGSTILCIGDSVELQSDTAFTYEWLLNGANTGLTSQNIFASTGGDYQLIVNAGSCSDTSAIVSVTLNALPIANITAMGVTTFCEGGTVELVSDSAITYNWLLNGAATGDTGINYFASASGIYQVIAANSCGTDTSAAANVTAYPLPTANAGPDTAINKGESIMLQASGGIFYQWTPAADLSNDTISNPVASPDQTTTYSVTVTDSIGCSDVDSVLVIVTVVVEENNLIVPNAFSPNGDGKNDILYVKGRNIKTIRFIIYNRWGEKVFETGRLEDGWDGKYKGQFADSAVFVYYVKAEFIDGTEDFIKGDVTLIR